MKFEVKGRKFVSQVFCVFQEQKSTLKLKHYKLQSPENLLIYIYKLTNLH